MRFSGSTPCLHTLEVWKVSSLRDQMPQVTAFVDDLRAAFGAGEIDGAIRAGLRGRPFFYAREGDHELGTRLPGMEDSDGRDLDGGDGRARGALPGPAAGLAGSRSPRYGAAQ
jgi:hypothetical protein